MTTLLFANNAVSTLASGISPSATTVQLAAGTGGLFPNPTAGQGFFATITDAATQEVREIVLCGTRTGDAIPVVRAQQGTTAETWNAGDIFSQLNTAGDMEGMLQPDQFQQNTYGHAIDVGGTVNSITATLPGGLTALVDGMTFNLTAAGANTGAATLTLTLGSTLQSAHPIQKFGSSGLNAGDIPESGFVMSLTWSATLGCYQINNPASGTAGSVVGGTGHQLQRESRRGIPSDWRLHGGPGCRSLIGRLWGREYLQVESGLCDPAGRKQRGRRWPHHSGWNAIDHA